MKISFLLHLPSPTYSLKCLSITYIIIVSFSNDYIGTFKCWINFGMFLAPDKRKPDVLWLKKLRIYFLLITKSLEVYGPRVGQEVNWQQLCNLLAFSRMVDILTHLHPRGYPQDYLLLLCHCLGVYSTTIQRLSHSILSLLLIPLTNSAPLHSPFLIMLSLATLGFIRNCSYLFSGFPCTCFESFSLF